MIEQLRLADGTRLPLPAPGQRLALAGGPEGSTAPGGASAVAEVESDPPGAWLFVHDPSVGAVVNGRPVQSLAWLHAGDRVCLGNLAFDLLGRPPATEVPPVRSFVLRRRGGSGAGSVLEGPLQSFDPEGQPVSAAAAALSVSFSGGCVAVQPGAVQAWLNGHPLAGQAALAPGDQLQVARARYLVEVLPEPVPEPVTRRLPAAEAMPEPAPAGSASGLGWLVLLAALLAAVIAALIYI
ncbi:MAG: hypothetical protein KF823_04670 [Xanthomonadales bacterium]|nr:hypothetical protein [Xanthomonadales bacterium]